MGARVVGRSRINVPCIFPPFAICARGEIGIIETDKGAYKVEFDQRFSNVPALATAGVGYWRVRILRWQLTIPIPFIIYEVSEKHFKYWLPVGKGYLMYIAFETESTRTGKVLEESVEDVPPPSVEVG